MIGSIAGTVTLFLVAIPFHEDPQQIETVGPSCSALLLSSSLRVYDLDLRLERLLCRNMFYDLVSTTSSTLSSNVDGRFTAAGFYVILRFPILIETVRKQGGSQVVLMRLAYFRRLTKYRVSSVI